MTPTTAKDARSVPDAIPPRPPRDGGLRIAFLVYRGNPQVGGQGIYTRELAKALVAQGHSVEVFSGPPWPELTDGVGFTPVPALDLYRQPDPFRTPHRSEFHSWADVMEFLTMKTGGFGEPWAFGMRVKKLLRHRRGDFDIIHDNQCMATGILDLFYDGWPVLETLHHPITVDRRIAVAHATSWLQRYGTRRWYGFLRMQERVVQQLPAVVTVSYNSQRDIVEQMGVDPSRMTVVPVGVDVDIFRPYDDVVVVPGRIMVTTSSDVAMKGLAPLLEAVALVRATRDISVVVVGTLQPDGVGATAIRRLGLEGIVTTVSGVTTEEMARLYGSCEIAVVPSLYEGFSLPAIEAMACGVPVVATTGGALPEVVGPDAGVLVTPGDAAALADAITTLLDDPAQRQRLGRAGRERVQRRFTWEQTARATVACYRSVLDQAPLPAPVSFD